MTTSVGFTEIATHVLIEQVIANIKEQYLADDTSWIIGFSGGKEINESRAKVRELLEEVCRENDAPIELIENFCKSKKTKAT